MIMDDDVSLVIESLDSLWFFSNVFSTTAQVSEPVAEEISKPISENQSVVVDEKSRGRENGKRGRRRRRRALGEIIDLGFDDISKETNKVSSSDQCGWWLEGTCGCFQKLGCLYGHYKNMPPLHDHIAMKQHLKSWAYAVACTVR